MMKANFKTYNYKNSTEASSESEHNYIKFFFLNGGDRMTITRRLSQQTGCNKGGKQCFKFLKLNLLHYFIGAKCFTVTCPC